MLLQCEKNGFVFFGGGEATSFFERAESVRLVKMIVICLRIPVLWRDKSCSKNGFVWVGI